MKKKVATSSMVVTETLFSNAKAFCVLFDSGAIHSFVFTRSAMQRNLQNRRTKTNYRIMLPNDSVVYCPISYNLVPIAIGGTTFPGDLIQFDISNFDIILRIN